MNVYVAMVAHYNSYGKDVEMVGVFSTYQKALDYLGECYANCDTWIEEEQIQLDLKKKGLTRVNAFVIIYLRIRNGHLRTQTLTLQIFKVLFIVIVSNP